MGSTSVVFVQRYGSALNSNVHFHAHLPDAVYFQGEGETLELITLPAPTDEQVRHLLGMIARRVTAHVQKAFASLDETGTGDFLLVAPGMYREGTGAARGLPMSRAAQHERGPRIV
jgi:hypothetical protein